jgi:hypothetical protein
LFVFLSPWIKAQEELEAPSKVRRRIPNKREKLVRFGLSEWVRDGEEGGRVTSLQQGSREGRRFH